MPATRCTHFIACLCSFVCVLFSCDLDWFSTLPSQSDLASSQPTKFNITYNTIIKYISACMCGTKSHRTHFHSRSHQLSVQMCVSVWLFDLKIGWWNKVFTQLTLIPIWLANPHQKASTYNMIWTCHTQTKRQISRCYEKAFSSSQWWWERVAKMCRWSVPFQRHNQAHIQINFPEKGIRLQTCLSLFLSVKHINMYSYSVRCANDCKLIKIIGAEPTGANGHGVHTPNANWRGECWRPFTLYISAMQKPTQIHQ